MSEKRARHAFGSSSKIEEAKLLNKIDSFDILFLDGDTDEPKIGWLDANGNTVIVQDKDQIIRVDELPTSDGNESVIYIYNNEGYIWDGTQCIPLAKSIDVTRLETQVTNLETQMKHKVDATTVHNMIEEYSESVYEIVEF